MSLIKTLETLSSRGELRELLGALEYRVARTAEELEKAYSLVYREYRKRNYVVENDCKLRLSIHNALPGTTTFVGTTGSDVLITATIISDSPLGLPMDAIYRLELDRFRRDGKKLGEVSMLASDTELFPEGTSALLNAKKMFFVFFLFKCVFDYVREVLRLDLICITINPRHELLYDFLLFRPLGELKTYQSVNGAPALAKYVDVNSVGEECLRDKKEGLHRMFFRRKTDPEKFSRKLEFTERELRYFFVEKTDIFRTAGASELACVKSCYPAFDFSGILG